MQEFTHGASQGNHLVLASRFDSIAKVNYYGVISLAGNSWEIEELA